MISRCLSAGSLRFLVPPPPCRNSPHLRLAYCLATDLLGVITFRTNELRPTWMSSILRRDGVRARNYRSSWSLTFNACTSWSLSKSSGYFPRSDDSTLTQPHQGFICFIRPVFLSPDFHGGSFPSSALFRAQDPAVTSDAPQN